MINAVNKQFAQFVEFATNAGKETAIATKSDVIAEGAGSPLEAREITVKDNHDYVGKIFRDGDVAAVNNEVRQLFKKAIIDMFGGEGNIPDSVKDAMRIKDYGLGKPLTARRILAVSAAIKALKRFDVFDGNNDKDGELARMAHDAGYTKLDFGRLNTAVNLLVKAKPYVPIKEALEEVIQEGSAANLTMNAGMLYMKDANSFGYAYDKHRTVASADKNNKEIAVDSVETGDLTKLNSIASNLSEKLDTFMEIADELLESAKPSGEGEKAKDLQKLNENVDEIKKKLESLRTDLFKLNLDEPEAAFKALFLDSDICSKLATETQNVRKSFKQEANPALDDLSKYLDTFTKAFRKNYDELGKIYKKAVGQNVYKDACDQLDEAVQAIKDKKDITVSIPDEITDNLKKTLEKDPFVTMKGLKLLCNHIKDHGDASLRFTEDQKNELRNLCNKQFSDKQKAEKIYNQVVDRFESAFFAEYLTNPDNLIDPKSGKELKIPSRPDIVYNFFEKNPAALGGFDPGLDLGGEGALEKLKNTLKDMMRNDFQTQLDKAKNDEKVIIQNLGINPQFVREYDVGYVKFKGKNIPSLKNGKDYSIKNAASPARNGYAEFLEETFDDEHKKVRQMVGLICSMSSGIAGAIDELLLSGSKDCPIKGLSRDALGEKGFSVASTDRSKYDNSNITFDENGNVKIDITRIAANKLMAIDQYVPKSIGKETTQILGGVKIKATVKITNVADVDLRGNLPAISIESFEQEELDPKFFLKDENYVA